MDYGIPNDTLHTAVVELKENILDHLLQQSHLDVNYRNNNGETPLLLCLKRHLGELQPLTLWHLMNPDRPTFLQRRADVHKLIENGADINARDRKGYTALHYAVNNEDLETVCMLLNYGIDVSILSKNGKTPLFLCLKMPLSKLQPRILSQLNCDLPILSQRRAKIVQKLIENGADINARDRKGYTALHYAVNNEDLEAVCMLLYYGIDVSILCKKMTAFTHAVVWKNWDLAEVLFDYYNDFSDGGTALYWAAWRQSPLAFKLVEAGADVNFILTNGNNVVNMSLRYDNAEFFKLIWPKLDYRLLLEGESFIYRYIWTGNWSSNDWVECMYLLLESPVAFDLLCQYKNLKKYFSELLRRLSDVQIKPSDRIGIIASWLSLGMDACGEDINFVFMHYGFGKELELFIYSTKIYDSDFLYLLPRFIFVQEDELGFREIIILLNQQIKDMWFKKGRLTFLHSLGFFALPLHWRQQLEFNQVIWERLDNLPQFPSLLELARNKARQYIRQQYRVYQAYHMYDAVKRLNLPQIIQDIILFKTPIYK